MVAVLGRIKFKKRCAHCELEVRAILELMAKCNRISDIQPEILKYEVSSVFNIFGKELTGYWEIMLGCNGILRYNKQDECVQNIEIIC